MTGQRVTIEDLAMRDALLRSSRPVHCKAGLAVARGRKIAHHVRWMTSACTEGRIHYFAGWECGDRTWDAVIIADVEQAGSLCRRCESLALGPFVYRCIGAGEQKLYIGSAKSRRSRMQSHRTASFWWPEVVRVDIEDQPDIETARRAEAAAIRAEAPLYNKKHNKARLQLIRAAT